MARKSALRKQSEQNFGLIKAFGIADHSPTR